MLQCRPSHGNRSEPQRCSLLLLLTWVERFAAGWILNTKKQKRVEIIPHEVIARAGFSPVLKYSSDLEIRPFLKIICHWKVYPPAFPKQQLLKEWIQQSLLYRVPFLFVFPHVKIPQKGVLGFCISQSGTCGRFWLRFRVWKWFLQNQK